MTWFLEGREENAAAVPPPILTAPVPSFGQGVAAGFTADRLERDVWNQRERYARDLVAEMETRLGAFGAEEAMPVPARETSHKAGPRREAVAIRRAGLFAAERPGEVAGLPLTEDQFEAEVRRRVQRDYGDALAILGNAGMASEMTGRLASGVADPITIASLPFGAAGGARIGTTMLIEGGINALLEATDLPRQSEMADYLEIEAPSAAVQITTAGLLGAGLGGMMAGGARYLEYRRARGEAVRASVPAGRTEAEHAAEIVEAARALDEERDAAGLGDGAGPALDELPAGQGAQPEAMDLLRAFEGLRTGAYWDVNAWRTGYGSDTVTRADGTIERVTRNTRVTRADAERDLARRSAEFEAGARAKVGTIWDDLPPRVRSALTSVAYNYGSIPDRLLPAIRSGDVRAIAAAVTRLGSDNGGVNAGRRLREAAVIRGEAAPPAAAGEVPIFDTGAGYTGRGQVATASGRRIEVEYEIVDAASLSRASGDLQPRDRSRGTSDAWIADTAARLDPALLLPAPTADRGAPIVGPDGVVESGNGRLGAIEMAYARFPDRAAAYREAIGRVAEIPEGVEQPVLIARRRSEMTPAERREFVIEAQDSGVAEMTPAETARATARQLTAERLGAIEPGRSLNDPENAGFVQGVLGALPRSQRNRLFDAGGALNADGRRLIEQALFARAWDAPDIVARAIESEEAGPLRALMDALREAAPAWAALRADIEAGRVRPEFDISAEVLDAMRTIATARELASAQGKAVSGLLEELLADVDLLEGAVSPLVVALVRKFHGPDRAVPSKEIAAFLKSYAAEARQAGRTGDMLGGVGVADVLRRVDAEAFADLPDGFARAPARVFRGQGEAPMRQRAEPALSDGAMSPEAETGDEIALAEIRAELERVGGEDIALPDPEGRMRPAEDLLDEIEEDARLADVIDADEIALAEIRAELERVGGEDIALPDPEGRMRPAEDLLDEIEEDARLADVIDACTVGRAA